MLQIPSKLLYRLQLTFVLREERRIRGELLTALIFSSTGCLTKKLWAPKGHEVVADTEKGEWVYRKKDPNVRYIKDPDKWGFIAVETKPYKKDEKIPTWQKVGLTPLTYSFDILTAYCQNIIADPKDKKNYRRNFIHKILSEYTDARRRSKDDYSSSEKYFNN